MTDASPDSFRDVLRAIPTRPDELPELRAASVPADPLALLRAWIEEEAGRGTAVPHAFALATTAPDGTPQARTVILKDLDDAVWFATPSTSPKGVALALVPVAEAVFYWARSGRQVRVRGSVERALRAVSEADFTARHPAARAVVAVGRQGCPLGDHAEAERLVEEATERIEAHPDEVPAEWTAYRLIPEHVDVVQLRPRSSGERVEYTGGPSAWSARDLWP